MPEHYYHDIISPHEVTIETLCQYLKKAYIRYELDSDGDILVIGERLNLSIILTENELIKFVSGYVFKPDSDPVQRLELCNRVNYNYVFSRFCVHENRLMVDYYLDYSAGLPVHTFIFTIKHFSNVSVDIVRDVDQDNIID